MSLPTSPTFDYWVELVELYEYKVRDLIAGRTPRGGRRSLGDLRDLLQAAPLDAALLRRFGRTDREWRNFLRAQVQRAHPAEEGALSHWSPQPQEAGGEQHALLELRYTIWREAMWIQAQAQAEQWLREPDLITLRVAYVLHVDLERGEHSMTLPRLGDPLTSLDNESVALTLLRELADQVCTAVRDGRRSGPGGAQPVLGRLRDALNAIVHNPYPRHPDQDVTTARVRAAERDRLGPELTRTLIEALRAETGAPRPAEERVRVREAAARLLEFLQRLVPTSDGGQGIEWPPLPQVLYASQERFALAQPDDGASALAVRLSGGSHTRWRNLPLRWKRAGEGWLLAVGDLEYRLSSRAEEQPGGIEISLGERTAVALVSGDYLYLHCPDEPGTDLGALMGLARVVAALLDPNGAYLNLRLARAVAQRLRDGRVDPDSVSALSADRYTAASGPALLAFARKGAENLLARLRHLPPPEAEQLFRAAAEAIEAPESHVAQLLGLLQQAADPLRLVPPSETQLPTVGPLRLVSPDETLSLRFAGEPLAIEVEGRVVTLRQDYKGDLAVVLPGAPAAILRDLLVLEVPLGGILLVRQGSFVMASVLPHLPVD
ncbi:hypothetical protein [Deinococcus sonorensis]|uniref:Uncharacterized protein n=2 Tax=Deinococcus sonorensis TaxID=309891 RepID=A0AAU7UC60_9DEIO